MKESPFFKEASLMLEILSYVAEEKCFALKGGTAINFFIRDLPRLSVDIDLAYIPIEDRATSLKNLSDALRRIAAGIKKSNREFKIRFNLLEGTKQISKLHVISREGQIKIEPNLIIRGSVFPIQQLSVTSAVEELFGVTISMAVLSLADLYGGKICAALDRQHPRDLFDIKVLFENEGLTDHVRSGFVVLLASHNRPMSEMLSPSRKDILALYQRQFMGMTSSPVSLEELLATRERLILELRTTLTEAEKKFLLSVKEGNPQWDLLQIRGIELLPAIQWKVANIKKMKPEQHQKLAQNLKAILDL